MLNSPLGFSPQSDGFVSSLGVGWVRGFVSWAGLEPSQGVVDQFQLQALDDGIASLPPGTKVVLDVVSTPRWESGSSSPAAPPHSAADYAGFIHMIAARFAGRVAAWEIWNEEDAPLWWSGAPDPSAYAALLRAAYPAVKSADPQAAVVLGGLTGNDYDFLSRLYDDGAEGSFDAVAVHTDTACNIASPYAFLRNGGTDSRISRWSFLGYREVHNTMLAHGDDKPIWMTELGWNTSQNVCDSGMWAGQKAAGVNGDTQAAYLRQAYHCLAGDTYVQVAIWFGLTDSSHSGRSLDSYGLLNADLGAKPAFAAMADYARNGDRLTDACGDFSGPTISLRAPTPNLRYHGPLPIVVNAQDSHGVYRISLLYDGHKLRNFSDRSTPQSLDGRMVWQGAKHISVGSHTLTIQAIDTQGNVSSTSQKFVHTSERKKKKKHHHRHRRAHHKQAHHR
ncbi:MAG TPA: Ig-like domain-containing protein [Solirubrobacteraceae bacterium]|nr:Ig-like domain-containing protein [Solirubrobacteraceae bacterium]